MSNVLPTRRKSAKHLVLLVVATFAAVILGGYLIQFLNTYRKIPESYAAWTTGNLIVDYLNTHSNQWPRSWEDLERATNLQRFVPIEELRTKVKINWDADFNQLLHSVQSNRESRVLLVTRFDGTKLHALWGPDTDPNNKIREYLLWISAPTNSTSPQAVTNSQLD